jgi:hypothetical protein
MSALACAIRLWPERGVRAVPGSNGCGRPAAVHDPGIAYRAGPSPTFAAWLDAVLRATIPAPGTLVTLAGVKRGNESSFRGVVVATHPHGFLVRGPHYRTFVAYRDLFCQEGHVRISEPLSFAQDVDRVNREARNRLPGKATPLPPAPWKVAASAETEERVDRERRLFQLIRNRTES